MGQRTRRALAVAAIGVAGLGACTRSDDAADPTTTASPSTTAISVSPDDAFDQALADQLEGMSVAFTDGSRQAGHTLCDNLTNLEAASEDATTTTDAAAGALTPALLVTAVYTGYTQPAVAAVVLHAIADHLCPEHAGVIEQVLTDQGQ